MASRISRVSSRTASGSAVGMTPWALTTMAFSRFEPMTAPLPAPPGGPVEVVHDAGVSHEVLAGGADAQHVRVLPVARLERCFSLGNGLPPDPGSVVELAPAGFQRQVDGPVGRAGHHQSVPAAELQRDSPETGRVRVTHQPGQRRAAGDVVPSVGRDGGSHQGTGPEHEDVPLSERFHRPVEPLVEDPCVDAPASQHRGPNGCVQVLGGGRSPGKIDRERSPRPPAGWLRHFRVRISRHNAPAGWKKGPCGMPGGLQA